MVGLFRVQQSSRKSVFVIGPPAPHPVALLTQTSLPVDLAYLARTPTTSCHFIRDHCMYSVAA